MKTFAGRRTIDGLVVTVDGRPLPEHQEIKQFTKYGFEWTYEGENPQQLALAILYEHTVTAPSHCRSPSCARWSPISITTGPSPGPKSMISFAQGPQPEAVADRAAE